MVYFIGSDGNCQVAAQAALSVADSVNNTFSELNIMSTSHWP